ncbi:hypothetical protein NQ318_000908 [Aromia moschata]|uniref:Major facilitator superfamily (MFS) profile domain-containing protein n=1 Tax=Aromia moschata TaxID=1265417 RepID=A0AAV8ZGG9_9CUCU|nr:hypothetical protein NQ318_000908 [Aromia moschata]
MGENSLIWYNLPLYFCESTAAKFVRDAGCAGQGFFATWAHEFSSRAAPARETGKGLNGWYNNQTFRTSWGGLKAVDKKKTFRIMSLPIAMPCKYVYTYEVCKLRNETGNAAPDLATLRRRDLEGCNIETVLFPFSACILPLTAGFLYSWSSPFIVKITNDKENYNITEDEASYFTVIPPLAMAVTSFLLSRLNDIFGRKPTMYFIVVPYTVSLILAAVAKDVWVFYASRLFAGMGDGLVFSTVPMYIGEVSTPNVRGVWGNTLTFAIYLGQLGINVIGSYCSVAVTSYICICVPLVFLLLSFRVPESPYFYVMKGRFEEAKNSLRKLRGVEDVEEAFLQLKSDVHRQMSETGTWKDLFCVDSNRRALFGGIFLRVSQQMAGIGAFTMYAQYIFAKSGGDLSSEVSSIIFFGAICIFNVAGAYTVDIFGRRKSYIVSIFFCGVMHFIEALYFFAEQYDIGIDVTPLNWIPLTGLLFYVVFYSVGVGIVPTLMLGELFSASVKSKGLAILAIAFGVALCITTKVFHLMVTNFGLYSPFLLFSLSSLLSAVLALYLVPETKGKTLEEIQQSLKSNKKAKLSVIEVR